MGLWCTADLHLGHANIIRYCHRPFADVATMDAAIVGAWNRLVGPDDEVWVLGDFALGTLAESLPRGRLLHGTKHLVVGNHDRPFTGKMEDRYLEEGGFTSVHHGTVELVLDPGHTVACSHFPSRGDSGETDRFLSDRPEDVGGWLLHGHVHDTWRQEGRQVTWASTPGAAGRWGPPSWWR